MATGITGRLIRRTTKTPLIGVTVQAINATTGAIGGTTTTNSQGFFEISGMTSAVYFAKANVWGSDWDLVPNIAEIYTDEIHVSGSGRLTVDHSFTPSGAEDYALFINSTPNGASSGTTNYVAAGSTITNTATGTVENLYAISGGVIQNAGSGAVSLAQGVTGDILDTGAGTITQGIGIGTDDVAAGEAIGVAIGLNQSFGGIVGTSSSKGLYINSPDAGANNYAVYSPASAKSYFAGAVDVVGALTHNGTPVSDSGHGHADHANRTRTFSLAKISGNNTVSTARYVEYADGSTTDATFAAQLPSDYVSGAVTLKYLYGSSVASNNVRVTTAVYRHADGIAEAQIDANTANRAVSGSANVMTLVSEAVSTNPTAGDYIKVLIRREGGHANDNNTGTMRVLGPWIEYTADM